jgi:hypothetical protein
MGKISGRKKPLAPGIGVHCLDRGTAKATEAPYDRKMWGEKHSALSVQCCGADNFRSNTDNNKKWVVKEQEGVFATRFTRNVVPGGKWNLDACESGKTLDEAFAICADKGLRMCTKDEVMANEQNMGCDTGSNLQWTSTPCDGAVGGTPNKDVSTELEEISSHNRVVPDTCACSNLTVANDGGGWGHESVCCYCWQCSVHCTVAMQKRRQLVERVSNGVCTVG